MTKNQEAVYVKEFAVRMKLTWVIVEQREAPDFVIQDADARFGLEVTRILSGDLGSGSPARKKEADGEKIVDRIRQAYELRTNTTIDVTFPTRPEQQHVTRFIDALIALEMDSREIGATVKLAIGPDGRAISARRSFHPVWKVADDAVGWVDKRGQAMLQNAVVSKARKISAYQLSSGLHDIRLLVVADRMLNSGKIVVSEEAIIDTCGFSTIYFFSYPVQALLWEKDIG